MRKLPASTSTPDEISFAHLLVAMFRVRPEGSYLKSLVFQRALKRVMAIFAQAAEVALEACLVEECPKPSGISKAHPWHKASRMKGNKALAMTLCARFCARGGGYITCKDMKEDLSLKQLGLSDSKSFGSRTASEYAVRSLVKTATFMEEYVGSNCSKVLNLCFDCAAVASEHVLSVIMRIDGYQFAGPTQLLPYGASKQQAAEALQSLRAFLDGKVPEYKQSAQEVLQSPDFKWLDFRQSTKTLLTGLANALHNVMPTGWSLRSCIPRTVLMPCPIAGTRFKLTETEKCAMNLPVDLDLHCIFDHKTAARSCDFNLKDPDLFRLCFSADEGTEAGMYSHFMAKAFS